MKVKHRIGEGKHYSPPSLGLNPYESMNMRIKRNTLRQTKVWTTQQLRASHIATLDIWSIQVAKCQFSIPEEEVVSLLPKAAAKPSSEANTLLPFVVTEGIPLYAWFWIRGTIFGAIAGNDG